jgi:membrane-bound ClpP family serine protease
MQTSRYLIVAAILFASELLLGIGLIGIMGGLVGVMAAIFSAQSFPRRIRSATVFLGVMFATFGWLILNTRIAKQNAIPVIAACKRFRSDNNRYPSDLKELTPALLSSLPKARYTLAARQFAYDSS